MLAGHCWLATGVIAKDAIRCSCLHYLKGFYAFFKGLVPAWPQISTCSVLDLSHTDQLRAMPLQVCFLRLRKRPETISV